MNKLLLSLEKKRMRRRATSKADLWVIAIKWLAFAYIAFVFTVLGLYMHNIVRKEFDGSTVVEVVSRFVAFYLPSELLFRYFFQSLPTANIKQYLVLPIPKQKVVNFFIGKTFVSLFNTVQLFFYLPFFITTLVQGGDISKTFFWVLSLYSISLMLHFIVILLESYKRFFYSVIALIIGLNVIAYYEIFDFTTYTQYFFEVTYHYPLSVVFFGAALYFLFKSVQKYYVQNLNLDTFDSKREIDRNIGNFSWLDRLGIDNLFIENDLKLIMRNKRAKATLLIGFLMIFYGFLMDFAGIGGSYTMQVFLGFFVTGGFMMMFGQYVPSWDSSHYGLIATQPSSYDQYLQGKWYIIIASILLSMLLCAIYLIKGVEFYLLVLSMGIFNIGVSVYFVLYAGVFTRSPIDLTSTKNIMGDKKAFNLMTLVISIPQILLPILIFYVGYWIFGYYGGLAFLVGVGLVGLLCRNIFFRYLGKLYQREKYNLLTEFKKK